MELSNDLYYSLREKIKQDKSGLSYDTTLWLDTIREVDEIVEDNPRSLNPYKRDIITDKGGKACHTLKDRIMSFRVNPWAFGNEIISKKVMGETSQSHFGGFAQKQKEFLRDLIDPEIPFMIASCCRGGAKTWDAALAVACIQYCYPRKKVSILGGAIEQSLNLYNYFSKFILDTDLKYIVKGDVLQKKTQFLHGGLVKALPASQKSVRGPRADILIIDECCQAESDIITAALPQTIAATKLKVVIMSTPDKLFHMFNDIYMDREHKFKFFKRYHWDCYECPWIQPNTITMFQSVYDKNKFRIEFLGEFGSATGTVFEKDDVELAIRNKLPDKLKLYEFTNGIDWGYKDPTVSCIVGLDEDGNSWVIDSKEYVEAREFGVYDDIMERCRTHDAVTFADVSHPFQNRTLSDELDEFGLSFHKMPFNKYKMRMIANLRSKFEHKRMRIYRPKCEKLLDQTLSYSYMDNSDMPKKVNDHHVDALMLAIWGHRKAISYDQIAEDITEWDAGAILDKAQDDKTKMFERGSMFRMPFTGQ